jgi:prepilin-type N-terminal cleavage/methylation domain-containing protein
MIAFSRFLAENRGVTLLELLLVMAIIAVLTGVCAWGSRYLARGWLLRRAGHQLLEDVKTLQGKAEMSGSLTMSNGNLVMQRNFLVFDATTKSYTAYLWHDDNGDSVSVAAEAVFLWQKTLPEGVEFGWTPTVDRRACSNGSGSPGSAISFSSPTYPPCQGKPCIKFDQNGFSVLDPGAVYLSEGEQSLAITMTRPGNFTLCEWSGDRWN